MKENFDSIEEYNLWLDKKQKNMVQKTNSFLVMNIMKYLMMSVNH